MAIVHVGILVFPRVQQLDVTGPFEMFATEPRCSVQLISTAASLDPVPTATGLVLVPSTCISACDSIDVLVIPGGSGVNSLLTNQEVLSWVRRVSQQAQYVCSVCTGAMVLGAAGLLQGKKATTHWNSMDFLPAFGAIPVTGRVVRDGNIFTAGGVTSGIDFGLVILAELFDQTSAEKVQLFLEYSPCPPFNAGHPSTASPAVLEAVKITAQRSRSEREHIVQQISSFRL